MINFSLATKRAYLYASSASRIIQNFLFYTSNTGPVFSNHHTPHYHQRSLVEARRDSRSQGSQPARGEGGSSRPKGEGPTNAPPNVTSRRRRARCGKARGERRGLGQGTLQLLHLRCRPHPLRDRWMARSRDRSRIEGLGYLNGLGTGEK